MVEIEWKPFAAKWKRRLVFYDAFCVFFFIFWRNGYRRIFTKSSITDVFAVLFVKDGTPWKPVPQKILGAQKLMFWSENSDSAAFEMPLRGNEEEF